MQGLAIESLILAQDKIYELFRERKASVE